MLAGERLPASKNAEQKRFAADDITLATKNSSSIANCTLRVC